MDSNKPTNNTGLVRGVVVFGAFLIFAALLFVIIAVVFSSSFNGVLHGHKKTTTISSTITTIATTISTILTTSITSSITTSVPTTSSVATTSTASTTSTTSSTTSTIAQSSSTIQHVIVIVLENTEYDASAFAQSAPYLTGLANNYSFAGNYFAVTHPSLPNYISMVAGSTLGLDGTDCSPSSCGNIRNKVITDLFKTTNVIWKEYAESMPQSCYLSDSGDYAVRHNPFMYFSNVIGNSSYCNSHVVQYESNSVGFLADLKNGKLPNFAFITPNLCNDGHDSCNGINPLVEVDRFAKSVVPNVISSNAFANTIIIITFDEGDTNLGFSNGNYPVAGGHIYTAVIGPSSIVKQHYNSNMQYSHFSYLATVEKIFNTGNLGRGDSTNAMDDLFSTMLTPTVKQAFPVTTVGWGGVRLYEAGNNASYASNPPSNVFPGEHASNMELQVAKMAGLGYNIVRVSFSGYFAPFNCRPLNNGFDMGSYSSANVSRAIQIANYYHFWLIIDYHGWDELKNSTSKTCWLSAWNTIISQHKNAYPKLIWEPLNEPWYGTDNVTRLGKDYQAWINQARALGDNSWIVVQNLCSYSCGFGDMSLGYPNVTDSQGKVVISLHTYLWYPGYINNWTNATAIAVANSFYIAMKNGAAKTGWSILNTEGGADPICGTQCPSDMAVNGSAGYSKTTLKFIQTETNLLDNNTQRYGWVWWPAGSWTDTPGAGTCGALNTWGALLGFKPLTP